MSAKLVIIYGSPFAGKTTVALETAGVFRGKAAVLSMDSLIRNSIVVPDTDQKAELQMAHTQLRLMTANYLKNGYNLVVEGPFVFERSGQIHDFESEIDQLVSLMRNLAKKSLTVRLQVSDKTLALRAAEANRTAQFATAQRINSAYKERYGLRFHLADTDHQTPAEIATSVHSALNTDNV